MYIVQPEFIVISRSVNCTLDDSSKPCIDYQSGLVAVWSKLVKADGSGILENSIRHGWCKCCTPDPEYLQSKKKYYYKRKTQRPYNFKLKQKEETV